LSLRSGLSFILKIVVLTLLLFVIMSVASLAVGFGDTGQADAAAAGQALLIVCLLYSIVLSYPIIRSRWYGLPLVLTVVVVFYGIMTFLSQIETVVFLKHLVDIVPAEVIPKLFLQGAIVAILFSPLAVLVHGKMKEKGYFLPEHNTRLQMPVVQWIWKLALLAVIYILIYIGFGMFVFMPLAGDAFQQFYAGLEMPQWILPFQGVRALIWVALALPVIRMMKGPWWEAGLAVSLLFSVLMGAQLLLPNEFMPEVICRAHFFEVTASNFFYGWIVVWVLKLGNREAVRIPGYRGYW
jgi:hypothetical protein